MPNQFSNRPPFCDFLERFQEENKPAWTESHYRKTRVGLGRLDEWLKICPYKLEDLNWNKLLEFHRYLSAQGITIRSCKGSVETAKRAIRWGIEKGELPQKLEDIYTAGFSVNKWDIKLPKFSEQFLSRMDGTRKGSYGSHRHTHKVFHTYLKEKNLTYRRLRAEDMARFMKYLLEKGFSQRTRSIMPGQIKGYLRWLYKEKKISRRAEELVPSGIIAKPVKSLPRPIDPEIDQKLQKILEDTPDQIYKAILLIRRTGMRITECKLLQYDCIEYDSKGRANLKVPAIKLGLERRVPLDKKTLEIVKYLQEECLGNYKGKSTPSHLLINKKGLPHRYEKYSDALVEICAKLNVKKWINLHALRHTYATSLLNAGVSLITLKEVLGHKSLNMSLMYAKVTPEKIHHEYQKAYDEMDNMQIPNLLKKKKVNTSDAFEDLYNKVNRSVDENIVPSKKAKLIINRLAKIKMEFRKLGID
jgi:site-specific recombinase XerD